MSDEASKAAAPSPLALLLDAADEWEHIAVVKMCRDDDFDKGFRAGVTSCAIALRDAIKGLTG